MSISVKDSWRYPDKRRKHPTPGAMLYPRVVRVTTGGAWSAGRGGNTDCQSTGRGTRVQTAPRFPSKVARRPISKCEVQAKRKSRQISHDSAIRAPGARQLDTRSLVCPEPSTSD